MNQCFIRPGGLTAVPVRLWAGIGSNVFVPLGLCGSNRIGGCWSLPLSAYAPSCFAALFPRLPASPFVLFRFVAFIPTPPWVLDLALFLLLLLSFTHPYSLTLTPLLRFFILPLLLSQLLNYALQPPILYALRHSFCPIHRQRQKQASNEFLQTRSMALI